MSKQKKEYRVIQNSSGSELENRLNELSEEGFVLRVAIPEGESHYAQFVMERDVERGAAS